MHRAMVVVMLLAGVARAESYWLWAIDGRFSKSGKPCQSGESSPARRAILEWIGADTYVEIRDGKLSLRRGKTIDSPDSQMVGPNGPVSLWRRGARTWIVGTTPDKSPAFATVTLVIERSAADRSGTPRCWERWIAPVSP